MGTAAAVVTAGIALAASVFGGARAQPVIGQSGVLPAGSRLGELRLKQPRQALRIERQGGVQSYLVALGNLAFSSPAVMGGAARAAGISCETCHNGGGTSHSLFIPGLSHRPGSIDVTSRLFNPATADGLSNPVDVPSLRGIQFTAPYGRDGRFASLRAFTRNVIVNEFTGAEPSPLILDALVAYMQQIAFLRNPALTRDGRLRRPVAADVRRGAALFRRPFEQMGGRSCASCHTPSSAFQDGRQHAVGTGGFFDTPTLLNARFSAPYFHDGRARSLDDVVAHFDRYYDLGLSARERDDLVAYLRTVGGGSNPYVRRDFAFDMAEIGIFVNTLKTTLARRDADLVRLTVNTINAELREIEERWPRPQDRPVRALIANWIITLRRVDTHAHAARWQLAAEALADFRKLVERTRESVAAAQPHSLYNPDVLARYREKLQDMLSRQPAAVGRQRQ